MRRSLWIIGLVLGSMAMGGCSSHTIVEPDEYDECPNDPTKTRKGVCGCGIPDVYDIAAGDYTCHLESGIDLCPYNPSKTEPGICGCGMSDDDNNRNGLPDCIDENLDLCPNDPNKTLPGICGCGVSDDIDEDGNGLPDCVDKIYADIVDLCPDDPEKTAPGVCGCGMKEVVDEKGNAVCSGENVDLCPDDPEKTLPGVCGCGFSDDDLDNNGIPDCLDEDVDLCPEDPNKKLPGICGCNVSDTDIDPETGAPRCISDRIDLCLEDPEKTRPGICGCGISDELDTDGDGTPDCIDECPEDPHKLMPGTCGCNVADSALNIADSDGDGIPNCLDACPQNRWKSVEDSCGCDAILYTIRDTDVCAHIISNAKEFIDFRDQWNDGTLNSSLENMTFMVVDDINFADVLNESQASEWVGIGTQAHPFDASFIGHRLNSDNTEPIVLKALSKQSNTLILGSQDQNDVSLFGYTDSAKIENIHAQLSFIGASYVAGIVAHASNTTLSNIQVSGASLNASGFAAGLVAELVSGSINNAIVATLDKPVQILNSGDYSGGIVASAEKSIIANVASKAEISGVNHVGGIAGAVGVTTVSNAYSEGSVTGAVETAALIAEITRHSSLMNAYTTAKLTCQGKPCAAITAVLNEFSTVNNAYSAGMLIDEVPEDTPTPPETDPQQDDDDPGDEPVDPGDTWNIPIASLVADIQSGDNILKNLFYWQSVPFPAIPDEALQSKYIEKPVPFEFVSLIPVVADSEQPLTQALSGNMTCFDNACYINGVSCLPWTPTQTQISDLDGTSLTVTLPSLEISMD